jgi:hypothetical protein
VRAAGSADGEDRPDVPSKVGGYQSPNMLAKPIAEITEAAKITKHLSPYFIRRTFQDLCRGASVHDFVARSISGHATVAMQQHYSSVNGSEVRDGLAKVISLAGFGSRRNRRPVVIASRIACRSARARRRLTRRVVVIELG